MKRIPTLKDEEAVRGLVKSGKKTSKEAEAMRLYGMPEKSASSSSLASPTLGPVDVSSSESCAEEVSSAEGGATAMAGLVQANKMFAPPRTLAREVSVSFQSSEATSPAKMEKKVELGHPAPHPCKE
jgi:hypothetical protein